MPTLERGIATAKVLGFSPLEPLSDGVERVVVPEQGWDAPSGDGLELESARPGIAMVPCADAGRAAPPRGRPILR
eukprot:15484150-Alexandrium_andersonii.AAC.1